MDSKYFLTIVILLLLNCCHAFDLTTDCTNSENPIACRSANFFAKALNQVASNSNDDTLRLLPGLEIIQNDNVNRIYHHDDNDERSMAEQNNETFFMRIAKYLQTHDLKIKFSDMVGKADLQEVVNNVFNNDDPAIIEARKKDKGGGGMFLMACLMMGKMLATMGLGGVGAMALKALGVSMMALMLAGIVGLKKLTEGGGDGGHSVHYVSAGDHHRRRRYVQEKSYAPLPYRGYEIRS